MLNHYPNPSRLANCSKPSAKQRGITLLITLIVLVAMTLAAISLMRSVDTTNIIAGNLAFRQSTILSGDIGIESAITWLETNNGPTLFDKVPAQGYWYMHQEPNPGQTWDQWWTIVAKARGIKTLATDPATGNTISYHIERMCANTGDPISANTNCAESTATATTGLGSSKTSGSQGLATANQIYYRITSRTEGPRNSVSYVQAIVAL